MSDSWLAFIPAIVTAAVGLAGLLGLAKYLIEPWYNAQALRRKYATALWIACVDLKIHLERIRERVMAGDRQTVDALKKIPDNDSKSDGSVRPDWFTKDGYYTTSTAYKIAAVSAWLRIYQRELLFLPYAASHPIEALHTRGPAQYVVQHQHVPVVRLPQRSRRRIAGPAQLRPSSVHPRATVVRRVLRTVHHRRPLSALLRAGSYVHLVRRRLPEVISRVGSKRGPLFGRTEVVLDAREAVAQRLYRDQASHQPGRDGAACGITGRSSDFTRYQHQTATKHMRRTKPR